MCSLSVYIYLHKVIQHTFSGHNAMTDTAHLGKSHHQYRTFGESRDQYRTLLESRDEYRTLLEHVGPLSGYTTNTATVLRFVFVGTTPSAAFVNASDLVGDTKRLRLPCFHGF